MTAEVIFHLNLLVVYLINVFVASIPFYDFFFYPRLWTRIETALEGFDFILDVTTLRRPVSWKQAQIHREQDLNKNDMAVHHLMAFGIMGTSQSK